MASFSGFGGIKGYGFLSYERARVSAKNWYIEGKVLPDLGAEPTCLKRGGAAGLRLYGNQK